MNLSAADKERNMRQFYIYGLRTLHFAALAAHSERIRHGKKETPFPELSRANANHLYTLASAYTKERIFTVLDYDIVVQDEELADALCQLPDHRRDIILLKYFLKWSDRQIAEAFESYPTTINHRRYAALKTLKKIYVENNG